MNIQKQFQCLNCLWVLMVLIHPQRILNEDMNAYNCYYLLSSFANYYIKNSCFCHSHSYSESLPSILHSQVIIPLKNLLDRFPYDVRLPPLSSNNELQSLHLPSLVPQYPPNYSEEALQDWKTCVVVFVQRTLKSFRCSIDVWEWWKSQIELHSDCESELSKSGCELSVGD